MFVFKSSRIPEMPKVVDVNYNVKKGMLKKMIICIPLYNFFLVDSMLPTYS